MQSDGSGNGQQRLRRSGRRSSGSCGLSRVELGVEVRGRARAGQGRQRASRGTSAEDLVSALCPRG
jgi:hypothetical protein